MTIARIRSLWTGAQIRGGGVTDIYYFASSGDEGDMAAEVRGLWSDLAATFVTGTTVTIDPDVFNIDEGTGDVVSIVTLGSPPAPVTGSNAGDPLPPATQGLLQWRTSGVVRNRRVRGRTFLPAQGEGGSTLGVPSSGLITTWQDAADIFLSQVQQPVVWSRPVPGGDPGSFHAVESAAAWDQWAVLRSRRD